MYSDIAFFVDNDNANFNIDNFFMPTGTSVPDLPTSMKTAYATIKGFELMRMFKKGQKDSWTFGNWAKAHRRI